MSKILIIEDDLVFARALKIGWRKNTSKWNMPPMLHGHGV